MISPPKRQHERNGAQNARFTGGGLAVGATARNVIRVVAVSREAETHCLNRYPSPKGRTGCPQGRPPRFFPEKSKVWPKSRAGRRRLADDLRSRDFHFTNGAAAAISVCIRSRTERGTTPCARRNSFFLPPPCRLRSAPVVATPRWNRPCWAAGQAGQPRFWSTAMSARAWCWAPRPTSPIARNTPRAAKVRVIPACGRKTQFQAIAGRIPGGGLFHANTTGAQRPGGNDGRDETCSTRS